LDVQSIPSTIFSLEFDSHLEECFAILKDASTLRFSALLG